MANSILSTFYQNAMSGFAHYMQQELKITPGVDYRVVRASNEPRILNVLVQINPKHLRRLAQFQMQEELAMAAGLAADQRLRIGRGPGGSISLEIPKPRALWFNLQTRQLPRRAGVVGLDVWRRPARVDFGNPDTAHCLIAGISGSGKTNTQQLLAWSMGVYRREARMIVIDVEKRGRQWGQFQMAGCLAHPVVIEEHEARQVITWCVAELDQRRSQNRTAPQLFVFIDEIQSVMEAGGCDASLTRIARIGREYEMHLVVATQHPTVEALGDDPNFRRNLGVRLISHVDDANAAYIATGQKGTGAEMLIGPGDSLLVQPGECRRLGVPLLTQFDYERLPRTEQVARLPLEEIGDPEHVLDVAKEETTAQGPEPVTPAQVAYALATGRGITHLATALRIGSSKAGRVKEFADEVRVELRKLGYILKDTGETVA